MWYQQPWWPLNGVVDGYLARLCALMSQGEMVPELLVLHPQESLYPLRRPCRARMCGTCITRGTQSGSRRSSGPSTC
jgi:hypothetical protein